MCSYFKIAGQVLEGGTTFPFNTIGFGVTEILGYFYQDVTGIEHPEEDYTLGLVKLSQRKSQMHNTFKMKSIRIHSRCIKS